MARQTAAVEVNSFIKGLVTEASPLTFPDNASLDEANFILNKDGTRRRRYGIDYEIGFNTVDTGIVLPTSEELATYSFAWKSPGGFTERQFAVIQIGIKLFIFDAAVKPLSAGLLYSTNIGSDASQRFSMTNVDGVLVVVSGQRLINSISFDGLNFTNTTDYLRIRDLFGVSDILNGTDLRYGIGLTIRPAISSDAHTYNLRNQTWAIPRYVGNDEAKVDCIAAYFSRYGYVQSNSDSLVPYLYAFPNDADDRETQRFNDKDLDRNPLGTNLAPVGYFVIDALQRGTSRLSEVSKLMQIFPENTIGITSLPADTTPGGASVVGEFGGRVWFGGFSSQLIEGDANSPRMTSYILFSQLVDNISDIYSCYQEGDPTSTQTPELIATDGGFLRLDGAYNIQQMVNVGNALMVVAENGVWRITGGSDYGFSATNYMTSKVSEHGSIAPNSIVIVDNTFMYWSDDGIYHVAPDQFGDWKATNLTTATIQTFFDNISYSDKVNVFGAYDAYQRRVRWLYGNGISNSNPNKELVLDVGIGAFYPNIISQLTGTQLPKLVSMVKVPPFLTGTIVDTVLNSGDPVVNSGDPVVYTQTALLNSNAEIVYLTVTSTSGTVKITFSSFRNSSFRDWFSVNGVGVDAPAFLITGWSGAGYFQRNKQVPYLTVHMFKTETGFTTDGNGDYVPVNASSVKVQAQWEWTNLAASNRWGSEFQAYRHKRYWAPPDLSSGFDDGDLLVVTKNKLRGKGKVLSLYIHTEPNLDCYLVGWSMVLSVAGNV